MEDKVPVGGEKDNTASERRRDDTRHVAKEEEPVLRPCGDGVKGGVT